MSTLQIVGYKDAFHYLDPNKKVDQAFYDNIDIGFTGNIAVDDVYNFALPYPADIDLEDEVMVLEWIDFIFQEDKLYDLGAAAEIINLALDITFSMLQTAFVTGFPARSFDTTNLLEYKKTFDGPYNFRCQDSILEHAGGSDTAHMLLLTKDLQWGAKTLRYVPPIPLDLVTPLIIDLINRSMAFDATALDTIATTSAFTGQTNFALRPWYSKRKRTTAEKGSIDAEGSKKFLTLGA